MNSIEDDIFISLRDIFLQFEELVYSSLEMNLGFSNRFDKNSHTITVVTESIDYAILFELRSRSLLPDW